MEKQDKSALRQQLRSKRQGQNPSIKKVMDAKILRRLSHMAIFRRAKRVLLYTPIPHEKEVDTLKMIEIVEKKGGTVFLPLKKIIAPKNIDLAIIPGIGFDKDGNRLGFGRGYYDRLLKKLRCPVVALAYDFQILHAIPRHEHDMSVHTIVTEKKIYHIS